MTQAAKKKSKSRGAFVASNGDMHRVLSLALVLIGKEVLPPELYHASCIAT